MCIAVVLFICLFYVLYYLIPIHSLHNLVDRYEISISQMTMDLLLFFLDVFFTLSLLRILPDLTAYMSNSAYATTAYPSRTPGFIHGVWWRQESVLLICFSCLCSVCFSFGLSSSCVLCTQCCHCLWIVNS